MPLVSVFFEPTDPSIASKPFKLNQWEVIKYVTPNLTELKIIADHFDIHVTPTISDPVEQAADLSTRLHRHIPNIIVTLGELGLVIARKYTASDALILRNETCDNVQIRHYPVKKLTNIANVSGAGDCFASGIVWAMLQGYSEERSVAIGFAAARASLFCTVAVPHNLLDNCRDFLQTTAPYVAL